MENILSNNVESTNGISNTFGREMAFLLENKNTSKMTCLVMENKLKNRRPNTIISEKLVESYEEIYSQILQEIFEKC